MSEFPINKDIELQMETYDASLMFRQAYTLVGFVAEKKTVEQNFSHETFLIVSTSAPI